MEEEMRGEEVEEEHAPESSVGTSGIAAEESWSGQLDDARVRLEELNRRASDFVQENPAVCILGAMGIGYLIGKMASRRWLV
jgi:ElaB/YqjD/DUF883 family membrane-anchored ribosome-binding protein